MGVPLVSVLQKYIKGRGMVNASHAKWLKSVLTIHTGYLVSVPDCQDLLSPVYALLETRTQHYNQVLQLRGKLELLTQPSSQTSTAAPRTHTLAQLLARGLHSNDTRILDSVLDRADVELIENTVKRIPAEAVVPLVTVLQKYIKGRGMVNAS